MPVARESSRAASLSGALVVRERGGQGRSELIAVVTSVAPAAPIAKQGAQLGLRGRPRSAAPVHEGVRAAEDDANSPLDLDVRESPGIGISAHAAC